MVRTVNPKVNIIDFGPNIKLENGEVITPDEFVWGAAGITYKDIGTIPELFELKANEEDVAEKIKKSLITNAGAGHASMATTPGFWVMLEGNSSKMVDSMFTGVRFGSSLMPSGRRIPVEVDQIVVPQSIRNAGQAAVNEYVRASELNIREYERLQDEDVPKQEAAKIVQYGHRGGGFMFMPLETLISLSKDFELGENDIPPEGKYIVNQMEEFVKSHGMGIVFEARKAAPRASCPNPGIFHTRENLAHELAEQEGVSPRIIDSYAVFSDRMNERIRQYLANREEVFDNLCSVGQAWPNLLQELEEIVGDFNDAVRIVTFANTPWRVWGEVKRHRTLSQTAESIYSAVERAEEVVDLYENNGQFDSRDFLESFRKVVSMPKPIADNEEHRDIWMERFADSIGTYRYLTDKGVPKSDAVMVIPRGIKLGVVKTWDPYNLTTGMMSLRLCNDVEPEMRAITQAEYDLINESEVFPPSLRDIMAVKCHYTGFCHNRRPCGNIRKVIPDYTEDFHKTLQEKRAEEIRKRIG